VQIHHLDGDPRNHRTDNLVVLCLEHHHEASTDGGLARKLSPALIKKYRAEWLSIVRQRRLQPMGSPSAKEDIHQVMLDALACHDILKIEAAFPQPGWDGTIRLLRKMFVYADYRYGVRPKQQIMSACYGLACRTAYGMPADVAWTIQRLAFEAMPIISLVARERTIPSENRIAVLTSASVTGFTMSYRGIQKKNLSIVGAGADILFPILRYVVLNQLKQLRRDLDQYFEQLLEGASKYGTADAQRWLKFIHDDAIALATDSHPPDYPDELAKRMRG
jgi:hypothetical protein